MALVIGTNCGFVAVAPTSNPNELAATLTDKSIGFKDTSPSGAVKITEIGFWLDTGTATGNFEVGLYAHDSGNDKPNGRLFVSDTNEMGGSPGRWVSVTGLDWTISASTIYWLGIQSDAAATTDVTGTGQGQLTDRKDSSTSLTDPWGTTNTNFDRLVSIYAIYEEGETGQTRKIKISGTFQEKIIKTKVSGTFVDKPIKIKVGGTFQDA